MEKYTVRIPTVFKTIDLNIPITHNNGIDLNKEDYYNGQYIDTLKQNGVNTIVDYEKKCFTPVYVSNNFSYKDNTLLIDSESNCPKLNDVGKLTDSLLNTLNKLRFDLCFREREGYINSESVVDDNLTWQTSDELKWFSNEPSLLANLGFTIDDVFFQKECLKRSFIRLSIYDSPFRNNQRLLHYSTIFFDTNKMYQQYIEKLSDNKKDKITLFDFSDLKVSFECTNKYEQSASSDGFYFYLFDKLINGGGCTTLYLKVDFNHAKFGYTIPFVLPLEKGSPKPLAFDSYVEIDKQTGNEKVNMQHLFNDMYIPIMVKYNYIKHEFVWFFPFNNIRNDDNITIKLFEPRINNPSSKQ